MFVFWFCVHAAYSTPPGSQFPGWQSYNYATPPESEDGVKDFQRIFSRSY